MTKLRRRGAIPPLPQYAFMAWCSVKSMFIAVLKRTHHWAVIWARCIQSTSSDPLFLRSILILYYHLRQGLQSSIQFFMAETANAVFISPMHATCPTRLIFLDIITLIILDEKYKLWIFSLCNFHHFIPVKSKYSTYLLVLKHLTLCSSLEVRDMHDNTLKLMRGAIFPLPSTS